MIRWVQCNCQCLCCARFLKAILNNRWVPSLTGAKAFALRSRRACSCQSVQMPDSQCGRLVWKNAASQILNPSLLSQSLYSSFLDYSIEMCHCHLFESASLTRWLDGFVFGWHSLQPVFPPHFSIRSPPGLPFCFGFPWLRIDPHCHICPSRFCLLYFPSPPPQKIAAFCHVSWDQTRIQAAFLNMLTFDHNLNQHSRRLFWYLYFAPSLFVILAFVKMFSKLSWICDHARRLRKATISVSESITTKLPQPYPLKQNRWLHYGRKLH